MCKILFDIYRLIFARRKLKNLNIALLHMSLRGLGILNYENEKVSGEKYLITKILPAVIQNDNPVFFDIGANVGNYSASLLGSFPDAIIHAFEPHPKNFSFLQDKAYSNNRWKTHNVAVGKTCGELTLYDRADADGSSHASLHKGVISEIHKQPVVTFTVPVETLDNFSERESVTYIDLMKIDTEGNELAVLQGASRLLENNNIGCIQFEFNEMNIVSRVFFRDFRKILHNYYLYRLLPGGLLHIDDSPLLTELFAYQNILALPKNMQKKF